MKNVLQENNMKFMTIIPGGGNGGINTGGSGSGSGSGDGGGK